MVWPSHQQAYIIHTHTHTQTILLSHHKSVILVIDGFSLPSTCIYNSSTHTHTQTGLLSHHKSVILVIDVLSLPSACIHNSFTYTYIHTYTNRPPFTSQECNSRYRRFLSPIRNGQVSTVHNRNGSHRWKNRSLESESNFAGKSWSNFAGEWWEYF